ncbi:unnamed protein product [Didymodactylos carnosus]|uniref:Serine protease n=1 Tax=Didymodactylos carnosus TaxID=1234261 RepID=A0A814JPD9_9BILA|nr:unnamed protein product [Didymodactylos carnosus]CAF1241331.1 unnamed protein product [Didymodactylos carnosus]CAF3811000.1 unnamed protein product [Didymodactylos carnosus]CAF4048905.1 unnamed protein product [Didymodactylos carnosus]
MFFHSSHVYEARLVQRGSDNLSSEQDATDDDLALLEIISTDNCLRNWLSKITFIPLSMSLNFAKSDFIPEKLYLVSYCGELDNKSIETYKSYYGDDLTKRDLLKYKLNNHYNVNMESLSIGTIVGETDTHFIHGCTSLKGSSGGTLINGHGDMVGIHVVTENSFNHGLKLWSRHFTRFIKNIILHISDNERRHWNDFIERYQQVCSFFVLLKNEDVVNISLLS